MPDPGSQGARDCGSLRTVRLEADRLTDALDSLADVAAATERHADGHRPLDDPDRLIAPRLRISAELAFDLDTAARLWSE